MKALAGALSAGTHAVRCLPLNPWPRRTLLGVPEQLEASYSDQLIRYLPGRRPQPGSCPELCCDATLNNETQAFLAQLCATHSHTATSIAYMLKANASVPPKLTLPPIPTEPPAHANAFSDGSVRHPTSIFSTATFGVVWPGRAEEERSEQERTYAAQVDLGHVYCDAGLAVAGTVPGIFLSSTRAELAGAIVALMYQSAVTLKADNEGVIKKALRHVQLGGSGRKPWSLHKDGDVWEMLFAIAHSRGFTSFSTQCHRTCDSQVPHLR